MALNKTVHSIKHPMYTYEVKETQVQIRQNGLLRADIIFPIVRDYSKQKSMIEAIIEIMALNYEEAVFDFGDSE